MGVPQNSQNVMKERILACARDMARWTHVTHKVLPMFVTISLTGMANDENDGDDDDEDGMVYMEDDQGHYGQARVPASEASIERLDSVVFGQDEVDDGFVSGIGGCSICLEDFKVGSQVTRMPCLHLYHRNCIVDWLRQTNSCPLCRFLMPPAATTEGK
ncbi:hypothetical protein L6164_017960 [Bauhinia variegata]|nr:hypothetical protein L6164_017960 [Bauhinia variegata]